VNTSGARPARAREPKRGSSWTKLRGEALRLGVVLGILLAIDVMTGKPFWVQWPALGIGAFLAFKAVPLLGRSE
jgi:hypothetical protein